MTTVAYRLAIAVLTLFLPSCGLYKQSDGNPKGDKLIADSAADPEAAIDPYHLAPRRPQNNPPFVSNSSEHGCGTKLRKPIPLALNCPEC